MEIGMQGTLLLSFELLYNRSYSGRVTTSWLELKRIGLLIRHPGSVPPHSRTNKLSVPAGHFPSVTVIETNG